MADTPTIEAESFGPNIWLIDEMYRRFAEDPGSVSPAWQEFFADYGGPTGESTGVESPPRKLRTAKPSHPRRRLPSAQRKTPEPARAAGGAPNRNLLPRQNRHAAAPKPAAVTDTGTARSARAALHRRRRRKPRSSSGR